MLLKDSQNSQNFLMFSGDTDWLATFLRGNFSIGVFLWIFVKLLRKNILQNNCERLLSCIEIVFLIISRVLASKLQTDKHENKVYFFWKKSNAILLTVIHKHSYLINRIPSTAKIATYWRVLLQEVENIFEYLLVMKLG